MEAYCVKNAKAYIYIYIYIYSRNLISCKAALQQFYRKKRYTNKLELNLN